MNYNLLENGTTITRIDVSFGNIKALPILPLHLETLVADHNFRLEEIPTLPWTLRVLSICLTGVQCLSGLPNTLEELYVSENPGIGLSSLMLPQNLKVLVADCCELEDLPSVLPSGLVTLSVDGNYLEMLPELPSTLQTLIASNNQLCEVSASVSMLPMLSVLQIHNNLLRCLPPLPGSLRELNCSENHLTRLPMLPESLEVFVFFGNPLVYEILHKRICPQDYINGINRFARFVARERIYNKVRSWMIQRKRLTTHPSFSSTSSFLSVSSCCFVDYLPPSPSATSHTHAEDEFIFL